MRAAGGLLGLLLGSVLISSCSGPTEIGSQPPVLSNFSYVLLALNLDECPPTGLPESSQFTWSVEFSDPNGDVSPPVTMHWQSQFSPSGTLKAATLTIREDAISAAGNFSGTITQRQCVRFGEQASIDITLQILDGDGNESNPILLRIERPTGAWAPPADAGSRK